jgi:23S rRNA (guanosine2251-2'-O)-methyltransferase
MEKKYIPHRKTVSKIDPKDVVFGLRAIIETLRAGKEVDKIFLLNEGLQSELIPELVELAKQNSVPVQRVPIFKLNKITTKNHQGAVAFVSAIEYASLDNIIDKTFEVGKVPLILILDRITDVRNFGAIARTAEGAGVDAIVIPDKNAAQINSDAIKTSAGALNFVPVCRVKGLVNTIKYLKDCGLQIIACTEKTGNSLYEVDFTVPTAIVVGSEEEGISEQILHQATHQARINMLGKIESLNVSVSAGIILYEAVRQRV